MRLTKAVLKRNKAVLRDRILTLTKMGPEELVTECKRTCGFSPSNPANTSEILHVLLKWAIEDCLPESDLN